MDTLRGIAMILVVLLHAGLALEFYSTSYPEPIRVFNDALEPYRMPTLMFLSGMLLTKSLGKPTATYFGGKLRKIVWPYAIWSCIILGLQGDLSLHAIGRAVYNPLETHLWYLWFLAIFYAVAWATRFAPPWALAAVGLLASFFAPSDFRLDRMAFLFGFFMLGAAFRRYQIRIERWSILPATLALAGVLAVTASILNIGGAEVLYNPAYAICVIGALILTMRLVAAIPRSTVRRLLDYIGQNSIILYIIHLPVIKIVGTLLDRQLDINPWLMFPVLVAAGFGASYTLMVAAERITVAKWLFEFPLIRSRRTRPTDTQSSRL